VYGRFRSRAEVTNGPRTANTRRSAFFALADVEVHQSGNFLPVIHSLFILGAEWTGAKGVRSSRIC
jgi:hypothetical protein